MNTNKYNLKAINLADKIEANRKLKYLFNTYSKGDQLYKGYTLPYLINCLRNESIVIIDNSYYFKSKNTYSKIDIDPTILKEFLSFIDRPTIRKEKITFVNLKTN